MSACFNDLKEDESFERWTRKLSAEFCHNFEQPEGKAMFKSKFCCESKEMKENNFTTDDCWSHTHSCLKSIVNHKHQDILLNTTRQQCSLRQIYYLKTCAAFFLIFGIFSMKYM